MDGYLGDEQGYQPVDKPAQRSWWKTMLAVGAYMIPLFWLFSLTGFPESFGVPRCHGRGCEIEDWYQSYLFLERHQPLDIVTFLYMWAPVAWFIGWFAFRKFRGTKLSFYADEPSAAPVTTPLIFDAEEPDERRRRILFAVLSTLAFGALLIAILYFKGA
jgi:hypothetical protein